MRVIIVPIVLLLLSQFSFAQQKKAIGPPPPGPISDCRYNRKYSDSIRKTFYPFNKYKTVKLVSFRFHKNGCPVKNNSLVKDSLIESKTLSAMDISMLTDILYNNSLKKENLPYDHLCLFQPRNAILFFDANDSLKESILICFHCGDYRKSSEIVNFGDECEMKINKLRSFFISKKLKFGTEPNKESYPGETLICCD